MFIHVDTNAFVNFIDVLLSHKGGTGVTNDITVLRNSESLKIGLSVLNIYPAYKHSKVGHIFINYVARLKNDLRGTPAQTVALYSLIHIKCNTVLVCIINIL